MNTITKEICLEKLDSLIESIAEANSGELQLYYVNKAEGFLLGLFYADIVSEHEFKNLNRIIDKRFLGI